MSSVKEIHDILFNYVPVEICQIIIEYLCILRMSDKADSMGINFGKLSYGLEKYKCVIAGSFPLLSLHNSEDKFDIDIYGTYDDSDVDRGTRYQASYPIHQFEEYLELEVFSGKIVSGEICADANRYRYLSDIKYCRSYNKREGYLELIDFISINQDPIKFINKTFDLSICKIIYDGYKLYINNYDDLINKKSKLCALNSFHDVMWMFTYNLPYRFVLKNKTLKEYVDMLEDEWKKLELIYNLPECNCITVNHVNMGNIHNRETCQLFNHILRLRKTEHRIKKYKSRGFVVE